MNFRNKDWRTSMRLTVDYNYMMKKFIGSDGFKDSELNEMKEAAADAFDYVADNRGKGMMGWAELPYNQKEIVEDLSLRADRVRNGMVDADTGMGSGRSIDSDRPRICCIFLGKDSDIKENMV